MLNIRKNIQVLALLPIPLSGLLGDLDQLINPKARENVIAEKEFSLDNRYPVESVNKVFKDNILLNLAYMDGKVDSPKDIKWDEIQKPFSFEFELEPNKTFAFHEDVEQKYKDTLVKTTNAHFNAQEGFKTDGYLFGDGVCHFASLIYWVAKDANLLAEAPVNHDFAQIPDIPKEYGVSIYSKPYSKGSNAQQNLYITNNKGKPVSFKFEYQDNKVKVSVLEVN
jgi:hypothetical protein